MLKILKYSFFDLIRSRWSLIYFLFYLITTSALFYLSGDISRAIISLMNIIIILSPLVGIMFGVMYYYDSREFIELLLAQPLRRTSIFLGQYLGLSISLTLSFVLGMGIPFVINGVFQTDELPNWGMLMLVGVLLTFIFTGLAFLISLSNENKIRGFGTAILVWLFLAVLYDGLFLLLLFWLKDYPLEKFALGLTLFNPIDLSRILMMLQLDISALMGYTGAVFNKFFGTNMGISISLLSSFLWILIPLLVFLKLSSRKDF